MTATDQPLDLLFELLTLDSPSGDEAPVAEWLAAKAAEIYPAIRCERLGDSLLAVRGDSPAVAVMAHIDTTGFTLGYERKLIPIGSPDANDGDAIRTIADCGKHSGSVSMRRNGGWKLKDARASMPGSRWVYAAQPQLDGDFIVSPYLDNRAGVWAALQVLANSTVPVAVAFTAGEEHSGVGALVCSRVLYEKYGITQVLVSDITWDTSSIHCGEGVAISLRDRQIPSQRFLTRILAAAESSGIPFQRELESSGGSDGTYIQKSGFPIDWVFVGAPERGAHSAAEAVHTGDLRGMASMLTHLVQALSESGADSPARRKSRRNT